jgi:uncharacterized membrane protein
VADVWAVWDHVERFPEFMTNVQAVSKGSDGRTHWVVHGPSGTTVSWDAEVTRREPMRELAWQTCSGSPVKHTGRVLLEPTDGGTRVTVHLGYNPVVGAVGHAVATLLGTSPKRQLDEDLLRMKSLVETGVRAHDAAQRPPASDVGSAPTRSASR